MKKFICVIGIVVLSLTCTGCLYKSWWGKRPCDQHGTKWMSEDRTIYFTVNENGAGVGAMKTTSSEIQIHIAMWPATSIDIYPLSNVKENGVTGEPIECWLGNFKKDDKFTATVERTTYFEVGQKITFYRVDDETIPSQ